MRIDVLDGFRAVAIMLVVGFHYGVRWAPPWSQTIYYPYGATFAGNLVFQYGWLAVELFFMMSGFVILLTLERCDSFVDFFRKRIARLLPALVLCASITAIALWIFGPAEWKTDPVSFVLSILFIDPDVFQPLLPSMDLGWVDGAYWTLAVEFRFYALVGLLFLLGRRSILPAWLVLQLISFPLGAPMFKGVHELKLAKDILMPAYLPYFTLGICAFEIWRRKAWKGLPLAGAAMATAMILVNAGVWDAFVGRHGTHFGLVLVNLVWIGLFALFLTGSPLLRPFAWKPLARLGEASYSLFLLHEAAGIAFMRALDRLGVPPLVNLVLVTLAITGVSQLIFHLVETPARNWLLKVTGGVVERAGARAPWLNYVRGLTQPKAV